MKKKILCLSFFALIAITGFAQEDKAVTAKLKEKYRHVIYHNLHGGWYSIRYNFDCSCVGACDLQGNEIVPQIYDDVSYSGDYYKVKLNWKVGIVDKQGNEIVAPKYHEVRVWKFKGLNYAEIELYGKWGVVDKQGNEIVAPKYDEVNAEGFNDNYYANVKLDGKWGMVDKQGNEIVAPKYDEVRVWNNYTEVKLNGKWGMVVDKQGNEVSKEQIEEAAAREEEKKAQDKRLAEEAAAREAAYKKTFEYYAKTYVQNAINEWQKKGEFEKTADWQRRVNETTRKAQAADLLKEAEQAFIAKRSKEVSLLFTLGAYDPDNEVYLIEEHNKYGRLLVPVPIAEAQSFKSEWSNLRKTPRYFIENNDVALAGVRFTASGGKSYAYSNKASLRYTVASIDYNFDPIEVAVPAAGPSAPKGKQQISDVKLQAGTRSDVDMNIPAAGAGSSKTFAIIIANESYQEKEVSDVEFAARDGEIFKEYCIKTLGLPTTNVHYKANATLNNIRSEISWLAQVAKSYNGEASIIFYYAGHGIPDEATQSAYLLPVDGYGSDVKSGYSLNNLYAELGAMPARSVTVFLDACFSGTKRDGSMLVAARGVAVKAKASAPVGNMVVFAAASGDETAYPYKEKGHGLFTYFLLKKLQESKGNVTLGELGSYISANVAQRSIVVNRKSQTPTVIPSPLLAGKWQNIKLK
ncbi:MAG: WG repeat-containing protein [Prevotellaceae bacterium]|jgi:hypothetical protein|nr:WG repeat-containing protein [Prevotellaceae bacterium]